LLERTKVVGVDGLMTARIQVETANGSFDFDADTEGRDYRLPMPEVEDIYRGAAANVYEDEQSERLLAMLRKVEEVDDVADLVAAMTLPGGGR
jgi:hypothetical protein